MRASIRLTALLTAAALLLCGCSLDWLPEGTLADPYESWRPETATTTTPPLAAPIVKLIDNHYLYDGLNEKQQENYDHILQTLYIYSGEETHIATGGEPGIDIELPAALSTETDELDILLEALRYDHPEFFYLANTYYTTSVFNMHTSLSLAYHMDLEERTAAAYELENELSAILKCHADSLGNDYEAVLNVHDELLERCSYNPDAENRLDDDVLYSQNSSAYYAICKGEAICGGYTAAMTLLLDRFMVNSSIVYNDDHIWNLVWIDDEPYHIDATWNDEGTHYTHVYFLLTTEEIAVDHEIPVQIRSLPETPGSIESYYKENFRYLDTADSEAIGSAIASQLFISERPIVELQFDPAVFDDAIDTIESDDIFCYLDLLEAVDPENDTLRDEELLEQWRSFYYTVYDEHCVIVFTPGD